jgi:hypothetical protein
LVTVLTCKLNLALGNDGGGPGLVGHQTQLTEVSTLADLVHLNTRKWETGSRRTKGEEKQNWQLIEKKGNNKQHMGYEEKLQKDSKRKRLYLKREEDTARSSRNKLVSDVKTI